MDCVECRSAEVRATLGVPTKEKAGEGGRGGRGRHREQECREEFSSVTQIPFTQNADTLLPHSTSGCIVFTATVLTAASVTAGVEAELFGRSVLLCVHRGRIHTDYSVGTGRNPEGPPRLSH